MEQIIEKLLRLDKIVTYKRRLKKQEYANSTEIAIETAKIFQEIIKLKGTWSSLSELIKILRTLGKSFINVDPLQFSVGNIIKRVRYIIF
jgi:translation initiation factor 2B subunit (eIF-2B alpha/beta/delta family)